MCCAIHPRYSGDPWFNTAIQSPSPAFEQSNPTATESTHSKVCDSSVALVPNSIECERQRSAVFARQTCLVNQQPTQTRLHLFVRQFAMVKDVNLKRPAADQLDSLLSSEISRREHELACLKVLRHDVADMPACGQWIILQVFKQSSFDGLTSILPIPQQDTEAREPQG